MTDKISSTESNYNTRTLGARWYVHPNDLIGGWCVMDVDQPPSAGPGTVADVVTEGVARHIADLHNRALDGVGGTAAGAGVPAGRAAHPAVAAAAGQLAAAAETAADDVDLATAVVPCVLRWAAAQLPAYDRSPTAVRARLEEMAAEIDGGFLPAPDKPE